MLNVQKREMIRRIARIVGVLLVGMAMGGCSKSPAVLSEEELLKILAEATRIGPLNFRQQAWPRLENKMITYCGQVDEVRGLDAGSLILIKVDKAYAGSKLPWSLEGKTSSPDDARSHQPGEPICMTGILEGFTDNGINGYWGHVKVTSLEKPAPS